MIEALNASIIERHSTSVDSREIKHVRNHAEST